MKVKIWGYTYEVAIYSEWLYIFILIVWLVLLWMCVTKSKQPSYIAQENRDRVEQIKYCHDNWLMESIDYNKHIECTVIHLDCNTNK